MLGRSSPACPRAERPRGPFGARALLVIPFAFALLLGSDALGILVYPLVRPEGAPLACRADTLLVMGAA